MLREFNKLCKEKTLCEIYTDAEIGRASCRERV